MIVVEILILLFAVSLAAWAVYVLVRLRPFTRIHYQHPSERLWKPLD